MQVWERGGHRGCTHEPSVSLLPSRMGVKTRLEEKRPQMPAWPSLVRGAFYFFFVLFCSHQGLAVTVYHVRVGDRRPALLSPRALPLTPASCSGLQSRLLFPLALSSQSPSLAPRPGPLPSGCLCSRAQRAAGSLLRRHHSGGGYGEGEGGLSQTSGFRSHLCHTLCGFRQAAAPL